LINGSNNLLAKYLERLRQRPFFKNFLMLSSGNIIAQLIVFAVLPIWTRLYSDSQIGIYMLYSSTLMVVAILATLKYELAVVLPKEDKDAANIVVLCFIITIAVSFFLFILFLIFSEIIDEWLPGESLGRILYLVPVSIFFVGIFQALSFWLNRTKHFKKMAVAKIYKSSTMAFFQSSFGFLKIQSIGLILGLISGQIVAAAYIAYTSFKPLYQFLHHISLKKMWFLAKEYKKVPLLNTTINLLNMISNQLPVFFLGAYYGLEVAGFYGLANRAINTPTGLISLSFGQVFYQRAAEIYNQSPEQLYFFVKKIYLTVFKMISIPFLLVALFAPLLFELYLGSEYLIVGIYSRLLVPWLFLVFMNSPVSYIVTILGKQQQMIFYDISLLIMRIVALIAGYVIYEDAYYSVLFYAITGFAFNLFFAWYLLRLSKVT
jgi:lipopolysaccharide exporter